ncbi:ribonuclease 3-like protein 3 isoform X2 [Malania oleifera]|uniref:ribonuclease 3-like protein 3 isoform X2 n=1 Tax=Malania oleifera TaxID=397392 RepID=UPI0025AE7D19|nr:ribonuclease 3-like protein 3 isoform X2 [Malania oleifera]
MHSTVHLPSAMEPKIAEEDALSPLEDFYIREEEDEGGEKARKPLAKLEEVEEILGYEFKEKKLLEEAFTHASFGGKSASYERLEYVGDSVLNLLITREQFSAYPDLPPGALTRLRAANVDTEKLARVAVKLGLHLYLRHKKPLLESQEFTCAILDYPLHSNGLVDAPKVLADIVESTIGAVFIDSNNSVDTVWMVFKDLLEPVISPETLRLHPRSELFEVCQKKGLHVQFVDLWKERTTFEVFIDKQFVGRGSYGLKKEIAQNRAAKVALENMDKILADEKETHENHSATANDVENQFLQKDSHPGSCSTLGDIEEQVVVEECAVKEYGIFGDHGFRIGVDQKFLF